MTQEDDRLFTSRTEMPWYQSNDLDWELAHDRWLKTQPDHGEPEDWGDFPPEEEDSVCRQIVNYYYNPQADGENIDGLLHLCRACHARHYPEAPWAQVGDNDMFCEICHAQNNPYNPLPTGEIGGYDEISNRFKTTG